MTAMAETVPAGSDGLLFLPYLLGERAPQWDPHARAAWVGLTIRHGSAHLVRSVMEGVVLQLLSVLQVLETVGGEAREMRATGGFARSSLWRQIMADIFGTEVSFPKDPESSCFGAAALGMHALGLIDSLHDVDELVAIEHRHEPRAQEHGAYARLAEVFPRLYEDLRRDFAELADVQRPLGEG
jgi:gluconokinase